MKKQETILAVSKTETEKENLRKQTESEIERISYGNSLYSLLIIEHQVYNFNEI